MEEQNEKTLNESEKLKKSLYDFTLEELQAYLQEKGFSKFVHHQIYNWLYKHLNFDPTSWSNLGKNLKEHIQENLSTELLKIRWQGLSSDGTRKFLLGLHDGESVETVLIKASDRNTLCISSQVGCAMKCAFCHTGTQGLKRNLKSGEILGQYLTVMNFLKENGLLESDRITNIVFMGQGEPLHNIQNVKSAIMNLMETRGVGIGQRRITLSTSGYVPMLNNLSDFPPVNIAISLHSARNEVRDLLMPINKVYDLEKLFDAIRNIPLKAYRRITYEYLLIDGINDTKEDIEALSKLLYRKESKINLIPFNEYPGSDFKRPSDEKVEWFCRQMLAKNFICTVRQSKGRDILAACGQLKTQKEKINSW